jgi:hypothetical protein
VRIGAYLLLEVGLAAVLVGVGAWQAVRGAIALHHAWQEWSPPQLLEAKPASVREDLPAVHDELRVSLEASGTFLGMSDDFLLSRMRTQTPTRFKLNKGGSSLSFRVDFADGSRAAFKPMQTNEQSIPRKEVAAYRLNRLLGLNAVPPAVSRTFSLRDILSHLHPETEPFAARIQAETIVDATGGTRGELSYWIPVIKDSGLDTPAGRAMTAGWLSHDGRCPPGEAARAVQVSNLALFDFLISNPDRYSGGNMKASADGQKLYFMDNTMSFFLDPQGSDRTRSWLLATQRFSRSVVSALERLDARAIAELSRDEGSTEPLLTPAEQEALLARRDFARQYVASLVRTYGAAAVLVFP